MLERATACLKHGARRSQRVGQRLSRSKRMLHSMFWNHGAGDLDLPPWAVSMLPFPAQLQSKRDNLHRGRQKTQRRVQTEYLRSSSAAFEGVFLDFLYPPQALAWLQRAHAQQWQRWERRNARRLPDGFIVAARGYASQPESKNGYAEFVAGVEALRESEVKEEHRSSEADLQASQEQRRHSSIDTQEVPETKPAESPPDHNFQPLGSEASAGSETLRTDEIVPQDTSLERVVDDSTVETPQKGQSEESAVDEQSPKSPLQSPSIISQHPAPDSIAADPPSKEPQGETAMQKLRDIMNTGRSGRSKNSETLTLRAMEAYDSLSLGRQADHRLKRELLEWLSMQPNRQAESKIIALFKDLPVAHRTLQTYSIMLSIRLRRHQPELFAKIHGEALQNLENGYQVSRTMFRQAVEKGRWNIALQIEDAHFQWYRETSQISLFWIHVSEIPQLLTKAIEFSKHLSTHPSASLGQMRSRQTVKQNASLETVDQNESQEPVGQAESQEPVDQPENENLMEQSEGETITEEMKSQQRFTSNFFGAAVAQEFLRRDGNASFRDAGPGVMVQRRYVRSIFKYLSLHHEGPAALLGNCLLEMVRTESGFYYPEFHEVASFVFNIYTKMPNVRPPEALLGSLLGRLIEYYRDTRRLMPTNSGNRGSTTNSLSIPDLVREWQRHYGIVSSQGVKSLLIYHARSGRLDLYEPWLEYLQSNYPSYEDQKDVLFTMIWVHARRADLGKAQEAFAEVKRITSENSDQPDIQCWNLLLHAHERADDLKGALTNLDNFVKYGNLIPDGHTVHGILQMFARRGDVEGVENLLEQYDNLRGGERETAHLFSLLHAHARGGNVQMAETVLRQALRSDRTRAVKGSLLRCFNLMLTAHSKLRNIDETMRTYRWMREEKVSPDASSYASIMQALVYYRRSDEAYKMMRTIMPKNNVKPNAVHYAILIAGYTNHGQASKALRIYDEMSRRGIRPTVSVRAAYLKARTIVEHQVILKKTVSTSRPIRLEDTMKELRRFLHISSPAELARHQSRPAFGTLRMADAIPTAYIDYLIVAHGSTQCMEAVEQLHREFLEISRKQGRETDTAPIQLLGSFASAFWRNKRYEDVEKCWFLAKEQADAQVALMPPMPADSLTGDTSEAAASENVSESIGDEISTNVTNEGDPESAAKQDQEQAQPAKSTQPRRIATARRFFLTRNLRYYLLSLHSQGRIADSIKTVTGIIKQGYTMDNKTWNTFIEILCRTSPPLALLAYVLTERFLMPNFPGWSRVVQYRPKPQAVFEGLQYIKARYLAPGQLMPQYHIMVWLGGALLQLRKSLAVGGQGSAQSVEPALKKYVGSVEMIRRHAPKTLMAVQTMPKIPDRMQRSLLRVENS